MRPVRDDFSLCATNQFYSINNVIMNFEKYFYSVCKKENELGSKNRVSFVKQGCKMNDFCLQPGSRFEGAPRRHTSTKRPLSTSRNRVSQWGGSFDD